MTILQTGGQDPPISGRGDGSGGEWGVGSLTHRACGRRGVSVLSGGWYRAEGAVELCRAQPTASPGEPHPASEGGLAAAPSGFPADAGLLPPGWFPVIVPL